MNENRKIQLGQFGKIVVFEQLTKNGWQNCTLNKGLFHIRAYKGDQKHLFRVTTRNHTTDKNEIKEDYYNLLHNNTKGAEPYGKVREARRIAHSENAISMWATIRVEAGRQKYGICYGGVADLEDERHVPMSPSDIRNHHKLAWHVFDPRIDPDWSNVKNKRTLQLGGQ
jgi:hypothetical protein